jgi:predicted molibdopterin-dependent oxidoreductase YjgC
MFSFGSTRRSDWPQSDPISFTFDGRRLQAYTSDTIASALIAAGVRTFNTHPSDGSARGGFCFVGRCSDCMVIADGQPGIMACTTPVRDGMAVETQSGLGHWADGDA